MDARHGPGSGSVRAVVRVAGIVGMTLSLIDWSRGEAEEVRRADVVMVRRASVVDADDAESQNDDDAEGSDAAFAAADEAQVDLNRVKRIRISLEAGVLADDNIFLDSRKPVSDVLYRISPTLRFAWGDVGAREESYLSVDYRPDVFYFQDNSDENTVDHDATVAVQKRFGRLAVNGSGHYQRTSGGTVDLGTRVPRDVYQARAGLTYGWGAKTTFATGFQWDSTRYRESGYSDSDEWVEESSVDYQITAKTRVGLGGGWGRLTVADTSSPQTFQRASVRGNYQATGKLAVQGRVGAEFRQTEIGDSATPIFGLDADYALGPHTTVRLRGVREVAASGALEGENYVRTGVSLGLEHRWADRFALGVDGGWDDYAYEPVSRGVTDDDRRDSAFFVRPAFTYAFEHHWKAELWYQWRSNDSTDPDQNYQVNQGGLNVRYEF